MSPALEWMLGAFGAVAGGCIIGDWIRLRLDERSDARAAKAAAMLSGSTSSAPCALHGCGSSRSAGCVDGRCRHHCRLYCHCPGNK